MNESEIVKKLNILIKLTAISALRDKNLKEQVKILSNIGLKPREMAELLGKSPNHIRVALFELRKKKVKE